MVILSGNASVVVYSWCQYYCVTGTWGSGRMLADSFRVVWL